MTPIANLLLFSPDAISQLHHGIGGFPGWAESGYSLYTWCESHLFNLDVYSCKWFDAETAILVGLRADSEARGADRCDRAPDLSCSLSRLSSRCHRILCGRRDHSRTKLPVSTQAMRKDTPMSQWRNKGNEETYSDAEVEQRLGAELPQWYLENGWIWRNYKTAGWKSTLMVINTVGHLAAAAFHHPDLIASYASVIVKLCTHSAKGITAKDFELAKKIEDVVMWQPGLDPNSALEGTPDDPRFEYLKYDR